MAKPGRLALINSMLTSMATYFLTSFAVDKWTIKKMEKIQHNFLWNGDEECSGAKCLVNWKRVCSPKDLGGLGIKDIACFSRALRLRWAWLEWSPTSRPWQGSPIPCDRTDMLLFSACTEITLGNGQRKSFWNDRWLLGMAPVDVAPGLFGLARRKKLTVKDALAGNRWMKGLERLASEDLLDQLVKLWELLQPIVLSNVPDTIRWKISNDGGYSAASAYNAQFVGRIARPQLHASWRIKAEPKVKFHMWLLIQNRTWTADRLATRGWPHKDKCTFCDQVLESAAHITLSCPFAREVWFSFQQSDQRLLLLVQLR